MSTVAQCDACQTTVAPDTDPAMDWVRVEWGIGRNNTGASDFCSPACAHAGFEAEAAARAIDAAQADADGNA